MNTNEKKVIASPTPRTLNRIGYLLDPNTLDMLLDEFQHQGMPMGSDRWAEYCLSLLRQRYEEARTLNAVMSIINDAAEKCKRSSVEVYINQRKLMTEDHQRRSADRENEDSQKRTS
jgi:hypothetical protein